MGFKKIRHDGALFTPPGDIDVLAYAGVAKRLFLVECKDLGDARTPRELAHGLQRLFIGNKKRSAVKKHSD